MLDSAVFSWWGSVHSHQDERQAHHAHLRCHLRLNDAATRQARQVAARKASLQQESDRGVSQLSSRIEGTSHSLRIWTSPAVPKSSEAMAVSAYFDLTKEMELRGGCYGLTSNMPQSGWRPAFSASAPNPPESTKRTSKAAPSPAEIDEPLSCS